MALNNVRVNRRGCTQFLDFHMTIGSLGNYSRKYCNEIFRTVDDSNEVKVLLLYRKTTSLQANVLHLNCSSLYAEYLKKQFKYCKEVFVRRNV